MMIVDVSMMAMNDTCSLCGNEINGIGFAHAKTFVETHANGVGKVLVEAKIKLPVGQCCYRFITKAER